MTALEIVVKNPPPQHKNGLATDQNLMLSVDLKFSALKMSNQHKSGAQKRKEKEKKKIEASEIFFTNI